MQKLPGKVYHQCPKKIKGVDECCCRLLKKLLEKFEVSKNRLCLIESADLK